LHRNRSQRRILEFSKPIYGKWARDKKLEERIELLKAFLESMDFKKLRRESKRHLVGGKTVKFVICWKENKPDYEMVIN